MMKKEVFIEVWLMGGVVFIVFLNRFSLFFVKFEVILEIEVVVRFI